MVGFLVPEKSGGIDQAVVKCKIPVGPYILGVKDLDILFGPASEHVTQFRIGPGGIDESDLFQFPFVHIQAMKTRIPAGLHPGREEDGTCGHSGISQVNMIGRNGIAHGKIPDRRIHFIHTGRIKVGNAERKTVFKPVPCLYTIT